jgi:hypothetical protein
MACTNQKALKGYLAEAKNHKVVTEKVDPDDGRTYLHMNLPTVVLEKIVNGTLEIETGE